MFILTFGLLSVPLVLSTVSDLEFIVGIHGTDLLFQSSLHLTAFVLVMTNCWLYAIGTHFHRRFSNDRKSRIGFQCVIYYRIGFALTRYVIFPIIGFPEGDLTYVAMLISIGAGFYVNFFAASSLKRVEVKGDLMFADIFGDFFAFLIYPIGVWWLQPRINRAAKFTTLTYEPGAPLDQHMIE